MSAIELFYKLMACHMLGDYVLQSDFLARTKGESWWHLLAHCVTYTLPFTVMFGYDWRVMALLAPHMLVDAMKARWHAIGYRTDQASHILLMMAFYMSEVG